MRPLRAAAFALLVATSSPAPAAPLDEVRLTPAEIARLPTTGTAPGTSGVAGIETRILVGDPSKPGPYTIQIRVPPNTRIGSHRHRDERTAIVISGLWHFGFGPSADEAKTKALGPGSLYTEPAEIPHFALTRAEGAVVYITGVGPSDTRFDSSRTDTVNARIRE